MIFEGWSIFINAVAVVLKNTVENEEELDRQDACPTAKDNNPRSAE